MDRLELQKLRDLPIEGVAERLGIEVTMHHRALCPFHDDHHPSLSFSMRKNSYRCFVCGEHGDVIDLVMKHLGKTFSEACRWLGGGYVSKDSKDSKNLRDFKDTKAPPSFDASRYARYFEHPWLSDEARHFLFDERRLDERVIRWCRLSSWRDRQGTPWLQIPYYSREGKLTGVQNRRLAPSEPARVEASQHFPSGGVLPRFRFPAGSECGIYNLPVLDRLREGDELWITEGCSDCWAMLSSGRKAIAIPSATLLTRESRELLTSSIFNLQSSITLHMYPDRDEPGERLFLQLRELLPSLQHHQLPPDCKDFGEMWVQWFNSSIV